MPHARARRVRLAAIICVLVACDASAISSPAERCTDTWTTYAGEFFESNCARFHGYMFGTPAQVRRPEVEQAIGAGRMPRDQALDGMQKMRILRWFACGAR